MVKSHLLPGLLCILSLTFSSIVLAAEQQVTPLLEPTTKLVSAIKERKINTVVVSDFSNLSGEVNDFGRLMAEDLTAELVRNPELFVTDRSVISNMLRKNNLSESELDSPEILKRIGKELGVQAIIRGTMHTTESKVRLNIKLIDIASGQLFAIITSELPRTESVEKLEIDSKKLSDKAESTNNSSTISTQEKIVPPKTQDKKYNAEPVRFAEHGQLLANLISIKQNEGQVIIKIKITNIKNSGRTDDRRMCFAVLKDTFIVSEDGEEFQLVEVSGVPIMDSAPDIMKKYEPNSMKCLATNAMTQITLVFPDSVPLGGPLTVSTIMAMAEEDSLSGSPPSNLVLQLSPEE